MILYVVPSFNRFDYPPHPSLLINVNGQASLSIPSGSIRGGCYQRTGKISDHSEFMVLALQLDDVYRESILGIAGKKA
jgi:hypothetical protein